MRYYVDGELVGPKLAKNIWLKFASDTGYDPEEAAAIWLRAPHDEECRETMWDAGVEVMAVG